MLPSWVVGCSVFVQAAKVREVVSARVRRGRIDFMANSNRDRGFAIR
jgi:hypothetical protein